MIDHHVRNTACIGVRVEGGGGAAAPPKLRKLYDFSGKTLMIETTIPERKHFKIMQFWKGIVNIVVFHAI